MTGTWQFVRIFFRRDRWLLLWWIVGGVALYYVTAYSVDGLYQTPQDYQTAAETLGSNAAFVAMAGPARALDTLGGQVAWQTTAFGAILVGLMSMFIIGRHTRGEEETGRDELLRAAAVGRYAPTAAAVIVAFTANLVLGLLVGASLTAYGLEAADSFGLGIGVTLCGWVFSGTALIAAQLASTTRAAYAIAGSVIALAYVLRAVGDVGNGVASWLSPIGWYQAMHQFSGLRWWPALLLLVAAAGTVAGGFQLFAHRDYGSGMVAARPGPARAPAGLRSSLGLARRLQRGAIVGWAAGLFFFALAYGAIGDDVKDVIGSSDASRELLAQAGGNLVDSFYATAGLMLAVIASGFTVGSALRPRNEEDNGHLEVLLATATSRERWLGGHVAMTVVGAVAILAASALGMGVGYTLVTGDASTAWEISYPLLQYVAPVLVMSAIARLLFGLAPRWMVLAWLPVALAVVVMMFGDLLQLPQWLQDLSPFEHLALMPAESFDWPPFVVLLGVAVVLSAAGQLGFRRRDLG